MKDALDLILKTLLFTWVVVVAAALGMAPLLISAWWMSP